MKNCIFVDVDDTLVFWCSSKMIPKTRMIDQVKSLHDQGIIIYLWSTGGAEYAEDVAKKLGITYCITGYVPKPKVIIDDYPNWLVFHPNEALGKTLDEYREYLK